MAKILDNISFNLTKDDKVAFIADSDITTTTLFKVIMGEITPDTGSVRWGVSQAYLPKDNSKDFEEPLTILDWLRQFAGKEEDDNTFLRSFLGRMLFSGEEVLKPVNVLSGGEKVRVMLSKLMLSKANVLVLDDPTNHLDLESITALNDGLMAFTGSILFASHDHQFIQTLANRIIAVSDKGSLIGQKQPMMNSWKTQKFKTNGRFIQFRLLKIEKSLKMTSLFFFTKRNTAIQPIPV